MTQQPIKVYLFRWAGSWGPFQVKIPCGECTLTKDVIVDTINKELSGIPVELQLREWLSEWWKEPGAPPLMMSRPQRFRHGSYWEAQGPYRLKIFADCHSDP